MGLDISLLETFTLVADLGSFSGAARRLGLTQPAVSFQVKALEKELGASLIDRSRGKVVLTPAGRTAYAHARKILVDREEMIADIPRTTGEVSGLLRVGASTVPGEYLLPVALAQFKKHFPQVTVSLQISDSEGVVGMLKDERIELGFIGKQPDAGLVSRTFAEDRLVAVTPKDHPLASKKKVALKDLTGERWVMRSRSSGTGNKVASALREAGISESDLEVVAEMGSTQAVLAAVSAGMGIAILSNKAAAEPARWGLLSIAEISGARLVREFYAVHADGRPLSRAAEEFLKATCGVS
ncbi:MAG TPA: selenium metabolism-associated LysR family transcriptional regulator [Candidatus Anoxymicrobiaceae bacterium]